MAETALHSGGGNHPRFVADTCLRTLGTLSACTICKSECPVAAIDLQERSVALDQSCIGCGRCTAVCPTGALSGDYNDTAALTARLSRVEPVYVDCERVPRKQHAPNTAVVPCLGALGANELLALRAFAGKTPITLADRQWCADCPAGGSAVPPGRTSRNFVSAMCKELGIHDRVPQLAVRPVRKGKRDDDPPRHRARRAFLRRIVAPGYSEGMVSGAGMSSRHIRLLALLRQLGGTRLPASALPAVSIDQRCTNNQLCASVCPTGALTTYADQRIGIAFDAERCISCGACAVACPEHAVRVAPTGDAPAGPRPLTAHELRACEQCDAEFAASGGAQALCPQCRKNAGLFARA